jgi:putative solute:sodium symporter small subunit|tara:strand:+ start:4749 stop:5180 length:432 start_codon:yes stop_codon:yes gene_type:complete
VQPAKCGSHPQRIDGAGPDDPDRRLRPKFIFSIPSDSGSLQAAEPRTDKNVREEKVSEPSKEIDAKGYWRDVIRLTLSLLVIWFVVSYGAGILFRDLLDNLSIGGAPLGFWFAQNGSIYVFVGLIFYYCRAMNRLEKKYGVEA